MNWQERKAILVNLGWGFPPNDRLGNVTHYVACSPNGWISTIEPDSTSEECVVLKAWGFHQALIRTTGDIVESWYTQHGEKCGILFDTESHKFIASYIDKVKGFSVIKEASGNSPTEAVMAWNTLWRNSE